MPWDKKEDCYNVAAFVRTLISIRKKYINNQLAVNKVVTRESESNNNLLILEKETKSGTLLVYLNAGSTPCSISLDRNLQLLLAEGMNETHIDPYGYGIYTK